MKKPKDGGYYKRAKKLLKNIYFGRRKSIMLLQASQAPPACPSDKGSMDVKTLKWLEARA
jgi:hypothetical protein